MSIEFVESDWKLFRGMVDELRERYLRQKNAELVAMLGDEGKTPTKCFWDTLEEMREEGKILRDCFDGHSRSKMIMVMMSMQGCGILREEDLGGFSEGLRRGLAEVRAGWEDL